MKELATFIGESGNMVATIFEGDDGGVRFYQVNYGCPDNSQSFFKVFMTEDMATDFANQITNRGNKPTFLSE
jgi:hypothetical protein